MKISELIEELQVHLNEYGDMEVVTRDEQCCEVITLSEGFGTKYGETLILEGDYLT